MEIVKANWQTQGNSLTLSMPIAKVNKQSRTVSGFATLDNVDSQGDIVTAEASKNAFERWRGNIREMHGPVAVGKAVSMKEDTYYDEQTGQSHKGIFVTVYVSKGAQDTWEKVLDGTLSGFSIGGSINKSNTAWSDQLRKSIRTVTDYDLVELSLVDNPANQLANIFSFQKNSAGETVVTGLATQVTPENIFWCAPDGLAVTTTDNEMDCPSCLGKMENIGWVEESDPEKVNKMQEAINKAKGLATGGLVITGNDLVIKDAKIATNSSSTAGKTYTININENASTDEIAKAVNDRLRTLEGGAEVAEETKAPEQEVEATEETTVENAEVTPAETTEPEAVEKAAEVSEVETEEPDFAKMLTDLQASLTDAITSSQSTVRETVEKAMAEVDGKIGEFAKALADIDSRVSALDNKAEDVEKRLDGVVEGTGIKKSAELGGSAVSTTKKRESIWRGSFLGADDIVSE